MIFTIRSLIDPTLRVGGRSDAVCASAAASAIVKANAFISASLALGDTCAGFALISASTEAM